MSFKFSLVDIHPPYRLAKPKIAAKVWAFITGGASATGRNNVHLKLWSYLIYSFTEMVRSRKARDQAQQEALGPPRSLE
eukprot:54793-Amorphochlora_amoeboformis.AAC.2